MAIKPILFNTEMVKAILECRKTQTRRIIKPRYGGELEVHDDVGGVRCLSERCGTLCRGLVPPCEVGDVLWVRETWRPAKGTMHELIWGRLVESNNWHDGFEYKDGFYHFPDGFEESGDLSHLSEIRSIGKWHPSIHMPKEAARIFLRVKDVRVEPLQSIRLFDALNEGITHLYDNLSDAEYERWAAVSGYAGKEKADWPYTNYLWHGHFGSCGLGNRMYDAWPYQFSSYENPRDSFSSLWNSTVDLKEWDKYGWDANPWVWVIEFERCDKPEGWG